MIILYSSPACPRCRELAAWLRANKISFMEKRLIEDLLHNSEVMTDHHMHGILFRAAPVLQVGSDYYGPEVLFLRDKPDEDTLRALL